MRGLSKLLALRAFEAVARHGSLVAAGRELSVTPAAVGQHVRGLEDWLGIEMFERRASGDRRLVLTARAREALPALQLGFRQIEASLRVLEEGPQKARIKISVSVAFFQNWLLSRISSFAQIYPEIELQFDISDRVSHVTAGIADIAIRYSPMPPASVEWTRLTGETLTPVCSPSLFPDAALQPKTPESLLTYHLIEEHRVELAAIGFPTWSHWLNQANVMDHKFQSRMIINGSASVIQAALSGLGIALGRSILIEDHIKLGRLIKLFPEISVDSPRAWYFVVNPETALSPAVSAFSIWFKVTFEAWLGAMSLASSDKKSKTM